MKRLIKKHLLENWSLKATALLLAMVLWIFVRGEPGPERVVAVPLEVRVPRQMEIINKRPSSIEVTMRGAPVTNTWFSQPLPTCVIDLQGAGEGEHIVPLTPDNVKISKGSGIEVMQVNPARVTIVLEPTVAREVPIVVPLSELPPKGFEIYRKSSRPGSVIISGPRSRINSVHEIHTAPISLEGRTQSHRYFVNLHPKDNSIRTSVENPILVEITLGPSRKPHTIQGIPVVAAHASYSVTPKLIAVQVLATPDLGKDLSPADFRVSVHITNPRSTRFPVQVKPIVQILNDYGGTVALRATHPKEVTVWQKK